MKKLVACLALCCLIWSARAQSTSFYVVAHPDDWQLFMGPNAYGDLTDPQGRVVFIYLTSGDDNHGTGFDPDHPYATTPYYLAREQAAVAASKFVTNMQGGKIKGAETYTVNVHSNYEPNGRNIRVYSYRNTIHYFLRISDHARTRYRIQPPNGYEYYTDTDIDLIMNNSAVTTIDGSATYRSSQDLADQVYWIMQREKLPNLPVFLNRQEDWWPSSYNYRPDHGDHRNAGFIAHEAAIGLGAQEYAFEGYPSALQAYSLTPANQQEEASLFAITANYLMESNYANVFESGHRDYLGRQQWRLITSSSRAAAPAAAAPAAANPATDLEVYPVPAIDELTVRVPAGGTAAPVLGLYDYRMRKVREEKLSAAAQATALGTYSVNIADVPAGVYFLKITVGEHTYQRKLVKAPR